MNPTARANQSISHHSVMCRWETNKTRTTKHTCIHTHARARARTHSHTHTHTHTQTHTYTVFFSLSLFLFFFIHTANVANGMVLVMLITSYNRVRSLFDTVSSTGIKSFTLNPIQSVLAQKNKVMMDYTSMGLDVS